MVVFIPPQRNTSVIEEGLRIAYVCRLLPLTSMIETIVDGQPRC
jgi:hypothetical protein